MALDRNDPDNIVRGGLRDKNHALSVYDSNSEIRAIYNQFGVTRQDIANSTRTTFNTTDHNGQIKVLGRENHANEPTRHAVKINGTNTTVYTGEFLGGANRIPGYKFDALVGKRAADGKWFAVMLYCGNIAYVEEPPKPAAKCVELTVQKLNRTHVRVAAKASVSGGAKINNYKFVILKDGKEVNSRTVNVSATGAYIEYDTARAGGEGTYVAKVGVNTSVGYKTSANCEKTFTIAPEPVKNIKVCDLESKKIVTIDEKDFDSSKHSKDLDDCKEVTPVEKTIEVCELETKKIITIKESEYDSTKHSTDMDDCKEVPVEENIEVCELATKNVITIKESDFDSSKHSTNMSDCEEAPVVETPPELPKTGIADGISAAFGLGSLIAAAGYYVSSRRNLLTTLLSR